MKGRDALATFSMVARRFPMTVFLCSMAFCTSAAGGGGVGGVSVSVGCDEGGGGGGGAGARVGEGRGAGEGGVDDGSKRKRTVSLGCASACSTSRLLSSGEM